MNVIIFSKDRACQLELLLRSMRRFWPWLGEIKVLMQWSDFRYATGYVKLSRMTCDRMIRFKREKSFKADLLSLINPDDSHTLFLVDDDVFIGPYRFDQTVLRNPSIACISLRLNPNLTRCHPSGGKSKAYINERNEVYWPTATGDYGYPMSLDGHIFRTADLVPMLTQLQYGNPNELEAAMSLTPPAASWIKCYDKSVVLNLPLNQVQTAWYLPHGRQSAKYLNWKFLKGYVIDLEPYVGYNNTSCHEIIEAKLITNP